MPCDDFFCQPSSKWVPFRELGKDKAAKGEGWAPPFICCAQYTVGSNPHTIPTVIRLWDTFTFILNVDDFPAVLCICQDIEFDLIHS